MKFLLVTGLATLAVASRNSSAATKACRYLESSFPSQTYAINETEYTKATEDYFTSAAWLSPACVFEPQLASEMGKAVEVLSKLNASFAVRGGGHMPISDAANIASGVLLSTYGLNQLELSPDKSSVHVGPGNRWGDVYDYLEPESLTVVGGRLGVVGVPGFLLGGGISFFSNEYGWASRNVISFEAILADGSVVKATPESHADLYWALKGGANSFAIVTDFELRTVHVPVLYIGESNYGPNVKDQFLDAVYDFAFLDAVKTAIVPTCRYSSSAPEVGYYAMMLHNGQDSAPPALANLSSPILPPVNTTWAERTMGNWSHLYGDDFELIHGLRQKFYTVSFKVDRHAMGVLHDIFFDAVKKHLTDIPALQVGLTYNVASKSYLSGGGGPSKDPMGVPVEDGPLFWIEENFLWAAQTGEEDARIDAFVESINVDITSALESVLHPYLYLNDADKGQKVFEGYGRGNLQRLQQIREEYDPHRIFTDLMPGGFKVAGVHCNDG